MAISRSRVCRGRPSGGASFPRRLHRQQILEREMASHRQAPLERVGEMASHSQAPLEMVRWLPEPNLPGMGQAGPPGKGQASTLERVRKGSEMDKIRTWKQLPRSGVTATLGLGQSLMLRSLQKMAGGKSQKQEKAATTQRRSTRAQEVQQEVQQDTHMLMGPDFHFRLGSFKMQTM